MRNWLGCLCFLAAVGCGFGGVQSWGVTAYIMTGGAGLLLVTGYWLIR